MFYSNTLVIRVLFLYCRKKRLEVVTFFATVMERILQSETMVTPTHLIENLKNVMPVFVYVASSSNRKLGAEFHGTQ